MVKKVIHRQFLTEYAQLFMFTESYNEVSLLLELYGEYNNSNRPQFNRLINTFKVEIDHTRTLKEQQKENGRWLQTEYAAISEIETKIKTLGQKVEVISQLKRDLHKHKQRLAPLLKGKKRLDRGKISTTGKNVWYRASFDVLLDKWGIYPTEQRAFFNELLKLDRFDWQLQSLSQRIYTSYHPVRGSPYQHNVNAEFYMSIFFAHFFEGVFADIRSKKAQKFSDHVTSIEVYDATTHELIKSMPDEYPFVLTNELLEECMAGYDKQTKEFLKKWNKIFLKKDVRSRINLNQKHNDGFIEVIRILKDKIKESIRDPLRESCKFAAQRYESPDFHYNRYD